MITEQMRDAAVQTALDSLAGTGYALPPEARSILGRLFTRGFREGRGSRNGEFSMLLEQRQQLRNAVSTHLVRLQGEHSRLHEDEVRIEALFLERQEGLAAEQEGTRA